MKVSWSGGVVEWWGWLSLSCRWHLRRVGVGVLVVVVLLLVGSTSSLSLLSSAERKNYGNPKQVFLDADLRSEEESFSACAQGLTRLSEAVDAMRSSAE